MQIELGSKVEDKVTGFRGTATARTVWIYGCERICVQPPVDKDGKLPDEKWFDAVGLKVLGTTTTVTPKKKAAKKPAGPRRDPGRRKGE